MRLITKLEVLLHISERERKIEVKLETGQYVEFHGHRFLQNVAFHFFEGFALSSLFALNRFRLGRAFMSELGVELDSGVFVLNFSCNHVGHGAG